MKTLLRPTVKKLWRVSCVIALTSVLLTQGAQTARADCANPVGVSGEQIYNTTHNVMQFCDGTDWTAMKGDGSTLSALSCSSGQVAKYNGSVWACAADIDTDTNTDTLSTLSCSDGQVAKWNNGGSVWECAADAAGSGGDDLGNHIATTLLRSDTHNTDDLGTTAIRWKDGWFQGTVTGGTFAGSGASLTTLNASQLSSGTIPAARIGSSSIVATTKLSATGTKNATTFLRGDNTWATIPSTGDDLGSGGTTTGTLYTSGGNVGLDSTDRLTFVNSNRIEFDIGGSEEMRLTTSGLDMNSNKISNLGAPTLATDAATKGYVDGLDMLEDLSCSSTQIPKWNGSAWACAADASGSGGDDLGSGGTTTGTLYTSSGNVGLDLTDRLTFVNSNRIEFDIGGSEEMRLTTSGLDMNSNKISDLGTPSLATDAATKGYVDTEISGISLTETDPQVASVTNNQWCRGTGSAVTCDQSPPSGDNMGSGGSGDLITDGTIDGSEIENASLDATVELDATGTKNAGTYLRGDNTWSPPLDPRIGTVFNGRWCSSPNGYSITCTQTSPSGDNMGSGGSGDLITDGTIDGSEIENASLDATVELDAPGTKNTTTYLRGDNTWSTIAFPSETDPQVASVTNNQWCRGTGSQVTCDQSPPSGNDNLGNHVATTVLRSDSNNTDDLGTTSIRWKNGWFAGNLTASAYFHSSDARLKTNIETISGLDLITKLRGVKYNWKKNKTASAGVIAQEVEEILPRAVHTDDRGMKSVEYDQLIAPLIEAVKELKIKNDKLQERIQILEGEK